MVAPLDGRLARDGDVVIAVGGLLAPSSLRGADAFLASGDLELGVVLRFEPVERRLTVTPTARLLDPDLDYTLHVRGLRGFEGELLSPIALPLRVTRARAPVEPAPSFREVESVLAGCRGCHEGATSVLGLDVSDLAHTAVGVAAVEVARGGPLAGMRRIEPFHPERSYLVYKMLGEGPIVGAPMGSASAPDVPLPRAQIAIVSRWIAAGALPDSDVQP